MRKRRPVPHPSRPDWRTHLSGYLEQHGHALLSSLGRLLRSPWSAFMTIAVMTVAISLAASFYVLVANVNQAAGALQYSHHLSVFLKPDIADSKGQALSQRLARQTSIDTANYIDKAQGLAEFRRYSGFGEALDVLTENPLPGVIQVIPKATVTDTAALQKLERQLNQYPEVAFVQMDLRWVERLRSLVELVRRGVWLLATLLALAVIFIVSNTIRLELNNRRDEVLIAKLVGATDGFIRRPFLYTGLWLGLLSGLGAWFLVLIVLLFIKPPIENLSALYESNFQLIFLSFTDSLTLIALSALLGMSGAAVVLQQQLKSMKPE
ncbi:MAG: permease-like cell division protein FtsX [Methylococcales bacterium]|nr:permease-like cell division protein FtsX [Methylococcales bacterium]